MRILLSILVWIVLVGGLWTYTWYRDSIRDSISPVPSNILQDVQQTYALHLTPTFSQEKDPFALNVDTTSASSMEIRINGMLLPLTETTFKRGQTFSIENVDYLVEGLNEIFIQTSPPYNEADIDHAIRVQLISSQQVAVDHTFWSHKGSLVSGTFIFRLEQKEPSHDH